MNRLHLAQLRYGATRERYLCEDWASANAPDFLTALGLPTGWWCGLNLPWSEIFGEPSGGDVDLIAGPLHLTIGLQDFLRMVKDEKRASPAATTRAATSKALFRAGREGLVQWPPKIAYTVVAEFKASHYDGTQWKAQHTGEKAKILGSLRARLSIGVNAVVFGHLGIVTPTTTVDGMDRMFAAASRCFPQIAHPSDLSDGGYYINLMAGMEREGRMVWGAQGGRWFCFPEPTPLVARPWHRTLEDRLAKLPRPDYFRTFVIRCSSCGLWKQSGSPSMSGLICVCRAPH